MIGELISAEDATPAAGRIAQNSYFAPAPGFLAIRATFGNVPGKDKLISRYGQFGLAWNARSQNVQYLDFQAAPERHLAVSLLSRLLDAARL